MRINVEQLEKRMKEENMTRKQFCELSGITPSGLSRILSGSRAGGFDILEGITRAFPSDDYRTFLIMDSGREPPEEDWEEIMEPDDDEHLPWC